MLQRFGEYIIIFGILDSGNSELVVTDNVIKDNVLLHRRLGLQQIEVVSTQTTVRPCYTIGIPINDPKYTHQEMRGLSVKTIISDLQELDLSEEVDICYQEYVRQCKKAKKLIKYPRSVWPDGIYGGSEQPVSFLIGILNMEMDIIFRHRGLYFIRTNLNSGQGQLSMGGSWKTKEDDKPNNFIGMSVSKEFTLKTNYANNKKPCSPSSRGNKKNRKDKAEENVSEGIQNNTSDSNHHIILSQKFPGTDISDLKEGKHGSNKKIRPPSYADNFPELGSTKEN